ncbi:DUF2161 family putative PD-(D/E)XK-type phosphodiesterase [Profundibacterium mesophilum]|uniref:Uncharacterized protein n=1 Tax=Profundibacterium mesophilum KAUST100406-0324 TaxID=1037889 RepID=A0A921NV07_9RHOB|nr:DUF2161 family putative PD-(D/E)XK-type phosphodiesterase [Profundibacterium mesophilum]KAF0675776.1 hypothetical protein PMES_01862 [Profundibacterium mesophilum KAUST100406-0324]
MSFARETDLYPFVKRYFEGLSYEVKGEVGAADVVACDAAGTQMVIVELKLGFTLALLRQGIARQALSDLVYLCVPRRQGRAGTKAHAADAGLCSRLGLGLMTVSAAGGVAILCDPEPYRPRRAPARRARLLAEFRARRGDPNPGGTGGRKLVTAYRQDAGLCAAHLAAHGPCRGADVARGTGVARATRMMADNHYGWFERVSTGVYALTEAGQDAAATLVAASTSTPAAPPAGAGGGSVRMGAGADPE